MHKQFVAFGLGFWLVGAVWAQASMQMTSDSIANGRIEKLHACSRMGGKDVSPQLTVTNIAAEAKFVSILMDDPDARPVAGRTWVHWNLFNVPVDGSITIPAGMAPLGDKGRTSSGLTSYEGMCPPNGTHTYRIAVFATREKINVGGFFGPAAMTLDDFEKKFQASIIAKAVLSGDF